MFGGVLVVEGVEGVALQRHQTQANAAFPEKRIYFCTPPYTDLSFIFLGPLFILHACTHARIAARPTTNNNETGNVRCWGDAEFGGLGSGDETNTGGGDAAIADFVDLGTWSSAGGVAAIGEGPCAVFADGSLKCWGKGYYGKNGQGVAENLGDGPGEMGDALPAVPLGAGRLAYSVAGGRDYNCAVLQDGDLKV